MTRTVLLPVLYRREDEELLDGSLNPEMQRQKLESLLAQGYTVKIANEFEYEHIHFTHYVLEKETKKLAELEGEAGHGQMGQNH